ncbi:hypothetical protein BJV77DRAFT_410868 [Russula vinacea]|nr:hypothetical protein BJV77DRAFT_410868 [Russula vinacea]
MIFPLLNPCLTFDTSSSCSALSMRPFTALPMDRHLTVPLVTIPSPFPLSMVRTSNHRNHLRNHSREQPEQDSIRIGMPFPGAPRRPTTF